MDLLPSLGSVRNFAISCLLNGLEPLITLCHYEIPWNIVTKYNGFSDRRVIDLFVKYANKFEKVKIKKEDLLEKDNFFGYILIDSNIHYIEGLSNKEYIFDYIVFNNIEDLLNYKIDNKKCFRDMKTIDLLMYNGGNPSKFKIL